MSHLRNYSEIIQPFQNMQVSENGSTEFIPGSTRPALYQPPNFPPSVQTTSVHQQYLPEIYGHTSIAPPQQSTPYYYPENRQEPSNVQLQVLCFM